MHTKNIHWVLAVVAMSGFALAGCGDDDTPPPTDGGRTDSGPRPDGGPTPDGGPPGLCDQYCMQMTTNCTGTNAQYLDMADCMAYCATDPWPEGTAGDMDGNTLACRIYHGGAPAADMPAMHCPHAGPSGGNVCGVITFGTEAGTRVDRMGQPAVSTALIGSAMKNAYNDADPGDDATGTPPMFAPEIITQLTALHAGLDDDLTGLGHAPCSMVDLVGGLPECVGQEVAAGISVAAIVIPDTLKIIPTLPAGYPNGRRLEDPVIDVVLSVILLDLEGTCAGSMDCGPRTLVGLNPPPHTDYLTTFPYLGPPITMP